MTPESSYQSPLEKHHHRIELREVDVFDVTSCLIESVAWEPHVGCAIRVVRTTERLNSKTHLWETSVETSYYLGNAMYHANDAARAIREHWHTENRNHYVRDVSLGEDASRIRKRPGIFARLRSLALNILRVNNINNIKAAVFSNALDFDGMIAMKGMLS